MLRLWSRPLLFLVVYYILYVCEFVFSMRFIIGFSVVVCIIVGIIWFRSEEKPLVTPSPLQSVTGTEHVVATPSSTESTEQNIELESKKTISYVPVKQKTVTTTKMITRSLEVAPTTSTFFVREIDSNISSSSPAVSSSSHVSTTIGEEKGDAAYESALLSLINTYRSEHDLTLLASHEKLHELAAAHSSDMNVRDVLSHNGFTDRFRASGRSLCVENVGWNYRDAAAQLVGWQQSPQHNTALLDSRITIAGISKIGAYVTFFACS